MQKQLKGLPGPGDREVMMRLCSVVVGRFQKLLTVAVPGE